MFLFRLLAPLLLIALVYWGVYRLSHRLQLNRKQFYWLLGLSSALLFVLILVILGRLPVQAVAAPAVFLLTFLMRNAHWLARLLSMLRGQPWSGGRTAGAGRSSGPASADVSTIRTAWLRMELRHDSGTMNGEVLEGQFRGRQLSDMTLQQLLALAGECREDSDSIQILQAYLDREHPDWREQADSEQQASGSRGAGSSAAMTEAEALAILGLASGASEDEIVRAHRRLMQKMHPDRGGSDYLAQRINQARDFLLR